MAEQRSNGTETTQIPFQEGGRDVVGIGAFRVLETYDAAADHSDDPRYQNIPEGDPRRGDIRAKMSRALEDFPELAGKTVTVGRTDPDDDVGGRAWFYNLLVNIPPEELTTFMTVYHELAHLAIHVRDERGEDIPHTSEEFCSIFAVARMPPRLIDERRISYLGEPSAPMEEWPEICRRALAYREDNHDYIKQCEAWLGID